MIEEKTSPTSDNNKTKDPDKSCMGWTVKNAFVPILVAMIGAYAILVAAHILPWPFPTPTLAHTPAGKIAFLLSGSSTARYGSQDLLNFKAKLTSLG
ncbi:MAG: hypothetical protein WCA79_02665 [Anaerolineales bacterium]